MNDRGERVIELRGTLPPHEDGPPLHIHHFEDEDGMVTAGEITVEVGGKRLTAGPGQLLQLPRGVPHRWWNDGDAPLEFVGHARPAVDVDRFLQAMFEVVNAGPRNRPPMFYMAHVILRHRRTQTALLMPRLLQALVIRATVLLGTVLGRYRGTAWPGCPDGCTGAPTADGAGQGRDAR